MGISLGANYLVNMLADHQDLLDAAVSLANPFDIGEVCNGVKNHWIINYFLLKFMKNDFLPHENTLKTMGVNLDFQRIREATDVIDFQKQILPTLHNIQCFDEYFEKASCKKNVSKV